jgi:RND family efflux transporter MFP subunit
LPRSRRRNWTSNWRQARAELANAKATAALSATTARRWQALVATDAVSRQEADEKAADLAARQSVVAALQANVDRLQATREFARLLAPFDGVVTARSIDVGALVNVGSAQGTELFVVSDTRRLRVYANVPQNQVGAVRVGARATLTVPESPGRQYVATVKSTSQAINAASGAMLVQLTVDNLAFELLPGGFATVSFDMKAASGTLAIPPGALIFNRDGLSVATVDAGNRIALKRVTVARDLGSAIEVASGLEPQDRVVQSPPDGIAHGDLVRIVQGSPAAGGRAGGGK